MAPEITEAYLNARAEFEKMSAEGIGKALQYFREMTLKAPDFAPGLAWHAACLFMMGYWGHAPVSEVYPSAKHLALQALAIDDSLARAHLVLAWMHLLLDWDLDAAMREVRRAIELSPSETDAHSFYSTLLSFVGQEAEAMRRFSTCCKLNPAPLLPNQYAAWMFLHLGQHARAEAQARRTIARFPDSLQPYFVLGWSAWYQGRAEDAVAAFENGSQPVRAKRCHSPTWGMSTVGSAGRTRPGACSANSSNSARGARRRRWPSRSFTRDSATSTPRSNGSKRRTGSGDGSLFWLAGTPGLDLLHADARFANLVRRLGIAPPDARRFRARHRLPRPARKPRPT